MDNYFEYTELREIDGKQFLYDPRLAARKVAQAETLAKKYADIREALSSQHYPTTRPWLEAIAGGGAAALKMAIIAQVEEDCKKAKVSQFVAGQWKRGALADLPPELEDKAEGLYHDIARLDDGLPPITLQYSDEGGLYFDMDELKERIEKACCREVTDRDKTEAAELREIVRRVRKLAEGGLDAVPLITELAGSWLAPSKYPDIDDDLLLFRAVALRRHNSREETKANNRERYFLLGGD